MRIFSKITILVFLAVFLVSASAMALPMNDTRITADNSTGQVSINGPYPGEDSLQLVLDNLVIGDEKIDSAADQSLAGAWTAYQGDSAAYTVSMFTAANGSFGIYSLSDPNLSYELMSFTTGSNPVDGGVTNPVNSVNPTINFTATETALTTQRSFTTPEYGTVMADVTVEGDFSLFGFYFNDGSNDYYTEDSRNGGTPESLAYLLDEGTQIDVDAYVAQLNAPVFTADGTSDWLLAFDSGGNNDFNDAVFLLEDMATPVPEPATLFLLGSGLLGFAGSRRRKTKK